MMNDEQLLQQYARERSESAFGELVTRHLDYVYSAALRVVNGDSPLAQDVTQTVFIDLARKAGDLPRDVVLSGWLHRHTCYTAATAVRTERRRQTREHTAMEMRALDDNTRPEWEQVAPYLDESLNELNPADRDALVLRFLRQQDLRAVGEALGISEDAARKRVDRALEKLHALLKHRGATLSVAALGTALATQAVTAAPAGLAGSVTAAALASAAASAGIIATIAKLMTITKLKTALIVTAVAAMLTPVLLQHRALERLREENARLANELAARPAPALIASAAPDEASNRLLAQQSELLRLRAEVSRLRQQQAGRSAASIQEGPPKAVPPAPTESSAYDTGTNDFSSEVQTRVSFGQTVVTGGWATSSGKRALVFVQPELKDGQDGTQTIVFKGQVVELAEATLAQSGLQDLATTSPQTQQHGVTYSSADANQLLQRLLSEPGSKLLSAPNIETSTGVEANTFVGTEEEHIQLSAMPTLIPGASGIDLKLGVQLRPAKHGN